MCFHVEYYSHIYVSAIGLLGDVWVCCVRVVCVCAVCVCVCVVCMCVCCMLCAYGVSVLCA